MATAGVYDLPYLARGGHKKAKILGPTISIFGRSYTHEFFRPGVDILIFFTK